MYSLLDIVTHTLQAAFNSFNEKSVCSLCIKLKTTLPSARLPIGNVGSKFHEESLQKIKKSNEKEMDECASEFIESQKNSSPNSYGILHFKNGIIGKESLYKDVADLHKVYWAIINNAISNALRQIPEYSNWYLKALKPAIAQWNIPNNKRISIFTQDRLPKKPMVEVFLMENNSTLVIQAQKNEHIKALISLADKVYEEIAALQNMFNNCIKSENLSFAMHLMNNLNRAGSEEFYPIEPDLCYICEMDKEYLPILTAFLHAFYGKNINTYCNFEFAIVDDKENNPGKLKFAFGNKLCSAFSIALDIDIASSVAQSQPQFKM